MSLVTWHPEESLNSFFVTDRFCNVTPSQWQKETETLAPKVNITETESSFHLEAETPGKKYKDINIEVHNGILTVKGHKESKPDKENYHIREFSSPSFERSFRLSDRVNTERVSAKIQNGILKIDLPKHEQAKPLKIEVQN